MDMYTLPSSLMILSMIDSTSTGYAALDHALYGLSLRFVPAVKWPDMPVLLCTYRYRCRATTTPGCILAICVRTYVSSRLRMSISHA